MWGAWDEGGMRLNVLPARLQRTFFYTSSFKVRQHVTTLIIPRNRVDFFFYYLQPPGMFLNSYFIPFTYVYRHHHHSTQLPLRRRRAWNASGIFFYFIFVLVTLLMFFFIQLDYTYHGYHNRDHHITQWPQRRREAWRLEPGYVIFVLLTLLIFFLQMVCIPQLP